MSKPKDWIEVFLPPPAYEGEESMRLHRFFIATCFVTSLFATVYFFMSLYMSGALFAEAMALSFVLFIFMPLALKYGVSLSILVNSFLAVIGIVAICLIYWEGGIRRANVSPWVMVLPAFAMMLQGKKIAVFWLLIALGIIAGFSYFTFIGVSFPVRFDISKDPIFSTLSMAGLVCLITFIFYISETERKKAHDGLEEKNLMLEKLSKEKTKFLQIAAHDLRNPLIVVRGLADSLSDPDMSDVEKQDCVNYIVSSTDRMSELIKNLLEIQVIEAGKMIVSPKQFSLTELINSYLAHNAHVASVKQTHIEVHLPEQEVTLFSDPARIEQILDNYVSNAIKYSPINSKVYLYLDQSDTHIVLKIKDEGPGLNESELDKLFKQFSTASSVPRPGEHATGLGLAIVKKIADALNAEVGCISEKGKGCTFFIKLLKNTPHVSQ
jgi:signal transduction histidine kinase